MAKCQSCEKELSFMDVMKSSNPARIKCSGCGNKAKVGLLPVVIGVVVTIALSFWLFDILEAMGLSLSMIGLSLLGLGLAVEYVYFYLLNSGKVKSSLIIE